MTSNNNQSSTTKNRSLFCDIGGPDRSISDLKLKCAINSFLQKLGPREDVLLLPPDYTRYHSQAGKITRLICEYFNFIEGREENTDEMKVVQKKRKLQKDSGYEPESIKSESQPQISILPALGTHFPMTEGQIKSMFGSELASKRSPNPFIVHDWRKDVETIGHAPSEMVSKATGGMVSRPWPAQLNTHVWSKRKQIHDVNVHPHRSLILSIGQVVPHEVMGMANFNKNLFVGVGGVEAINLSHFIGAVHGMEKMMGRADNPLRSILNYASENFLQSELDLYYILTVMGTNAKNGELEMKGLYIGNDIQCYNLACDLSLKVNFNMLNRSPQKIVVYLDPDEFHTTWLGNKAIYRTRMAIADGGELIILAPGVKQFGEDDEIDVLIRAHGYRGTPTVLEAMKKSPALKENLSAVAHLIHGSSEGRFKVTYCPGHLSQEEVENVGFEYNDLNIMKKKYDINTLKDGWNDEAGADGEEFYYISNPALGLWAVQSRFGSSPDEAGKESSLTCAVETGVVHQVASNNSGGVGGWKKPPSN